MKPISSAFVPSGGTLISAGIMLYVVLNIAYAHSYCSLFYTTVSRNASNKEKFYGAVSRKQNKIVLVPSIFAALHSYLGLQSGIQTSTELCSYSRRSKRHPFSSLATSAPPGVNVYFFVRITSQCKHGKAKNRQPMGHWNESRSSLCLFTARSEGKAFGKPSV